MPLPGLPQPGRDRDRHSRRQARGSVAPRRSGLADCAPQDPARPECSIEQEPDLLLLSGRTPMATARIWGYRPGLVDLATGQISREVFVNDEIYQQELERVFTRAWLFVGHES